MITPIAFLAFMMSPFLLIYILTIKISKDDDWVYWLKQEIRRLKYHVRNNFDQLRKDNTYPQYALLISARQWQLSYYTGSKAYNE